MGSSARPYGGPKWHTTYGDKSWRPAAPPSEGEGFALLQADESDLHVLPMNGSGGTVRLVITWERFSNKAVPSKRRPVSTDRPGS